MGKGETWLSVLLEERTARLLLLPLGTVAVTLAMTWFLAQEADRRPPPLFVASGMNSAGFEPWSRWLARYFFWHLLLFGVVSFKRRALPHQARWVADVTGYLLLLNLWTGYAQGPSVLPPRLAAALNVVTGVTAFVFGLLETVIVWWPEPAFASAYVVVAAIFAVTYTLNSSGDAGLPESGIPFIRDRWDILLQWTLVAVHFTVVWLRFPTVQAETLQGTWQPYLPANVANLLFGRPPRQPAKYDVEGHPSGVLVLYEERTVRLLAVPLGALEVSAVMSVLAAQEAGREEGFVSVSDGLRDLVGTPWSLWLAWYYLWHVLVFSVASFKRRALPEEAAWVSDFTATTVLLVLWSGYSQTGTTLPPGLMFWIHFTAGAALHVFLVLEAVVLWWPNRAVAAAYVLLLAVLVAMLALQQQQQGVAFPGTGISLMRSSIEVVLQWALVVAHFAIVWYRFPRVQTQALNGVWEPYLPPALASLLFGRELQQQPATGTYCNVPTGTGLLLTA